MPIWDTSDTKKSSWVLLDSYKDDKFGRHSFCKKWLSWNLYKSRPSKYLSKRSTRYRVVCCVFLGCPMFFPGCPSFLGKIAISLGFSHGFPMAFPSFPMAFPFGRRGRRLRILRVHIQARARKALLALQQLQNDLQRFRPGPVGWLIYG